MTDIKLIESCCKVFARDDADALPDLSGTRSCLRGEIYAFEAVLHSDVPVRIVLSAPDGISGRICRVEDVPVTLPTYPTTNDPDYLSREAGEYPDLLVPLGAGELLPASKRTVFWLELAVPEEAMPGSYPICLCAEDDSGNAVAEAGFTLEILSAALPEQKLIYTQWFHSDCLASYYCVDPLSEAHWALIERYAAFAAAHGMNMLYMPVFTPALDTAVGGERPTVQLVGVTKDGNDYLFDFSLVDRWLAMCDRVGIRYHEIAHLFTQWGAEHAPKILGLENGRLTRLFGWETDSLSEEYIGFLRAFLAAFKAYLAGKGILERCMFHLSDEPNEAHLERYQKIREALADSLSGLACGEALSRLEFAENGFVQYPIVATNRIEPFLERGISPLWAYYCCGQHEAASNRFVAMSMNRTRVIGIQLFKYHIQGFLHWGYNFWYTMGSRHVIDPYKTLDGGGQAPAGDPFSVYPGPDGQPYASLRLKAFAQALQDLRALEGLAERIGRDEVLAILEEEGRFTFMDFRRDADFCERTRQRINRKYKELSEV